MAIASEQQPQETASPWRSRLTYLMDSCLQVATVFILYVFSLGPMYWSWCRGVYSGKSPLVVRIYSPLYHLAGWCPPFGEWLNWYVQMWIDWG